MTRFPLHIPAGRRGATLTEVLLAILILSVGVSSVIALFPISILNSVKATQLTNARLLKEDVEQIIRVNPQYLTSVTNSSVPVQQFGWAGNGKYGDQWAAGVTYQVGDIVVPTPRRGSYRAEPFRMFRALVFNGAGTYVGGSAVSGLSEPQWGLSSIQVTIGGTQYQALVALDVYDATNNRQIAWEPVDIGVLAQAIDANLVLTNSWVLDPLGAATFAADTTAPPMEFGCVSSDGSGNRNKDGVIGQSVTQFGWSAGVPRMNAGLTTVTLARFLSTHPDAWSEVATFTPIAATSNSLTLPPGVQVTSPTNSDLRLVIRNEDKTRSVIRSFTTVAGPPVQLNFTQSIPSGFNSFGTVSVEAFDSRYTWFATVNNSSPGNPVIKIAVVFKRKFLPGEEHIYRSVFGNTAGGYTGPGSDTDFSNAWNNQVGNGNSISSDQVFVAWNPSVEPEPLIQEGKYIFRPNPSGTGVEWYKIIAIDKYQSSGLSSAIITVDRSVNGRTVSGAIDRAMLLRGIVEVFDL